MSVDMPGRGFRLPLAAACVALLLCAACGALSSDASIEGTFHNHQPEFEALRMMVEEESSVISFAPHYMLRNGGYFIFRDHQPTEQELGMTKERWSLYLKQMNALGLTQISIGAGGVSFKGDRESFSNCDRAKGIIYSSAPLKPLLKALDGYRPTPDVTDDRGGYVVFKELSPHWYLFLQGS
jgi:hypothetical protein